MMYMLDTNILIYIQKKPSACGARKNQPFAQPRQIVHEFYQLRRIVKRRARQPNP